MKTILILDAVRGPSSCSDLDDLLPRDARVLRSDRVPAGRHLDQILVNDHGTLDCLAAARSALAFRSDHPGCRVRILREVEQDRSEPEALLRALAPRQDVESFGVAVAAISEVVRAQGQFDARLDAEGILFEYAA